MQDLSQIETRFIGRVVHDALPLLARKKANVDVRGFMPRLEGLHCLQESDFVLLIATDPGSHAGKLFDYLGSGKPILALSPPGGEIDKLLQRTRSGWCADPWDKDAIREMILSAYRRLTEGGAPIIIPNREVIRDIPGRRYWLGSRWRPESALLGAKRRRSQSRHMLHIGPS